MTKEIKVGTLVKYNHKPGVPLHRVGMVVFKDEMDSLTEYYEVRWTNHSSNERNWYRVEELKVIG